MVNNGEIVQPLKIGIPSPYYQDFTLFFTFVTYGSLIQHLCKRYKEDYNNISVPCSSLNWLNFLSESIHFSWEKKLKLVGSHY